MFSVKIKKFLSLMIAAALLCTIYVCASAQAAELNPDNAAVSEMFTQRDFDGSYENAADIQLADGASSSESSAVRIDGDMVYISQEGVYRLSGSLSHGQVIVNAPDIAKVQLVLDGVSISNAGSAAVQVACADKVFVTTTANSDNHLISTGGLINEDIDAAVYSKNDICFNGEGRLTVSSESGHGIATKDDLKICSGSYEIKALKRGLSGKDSIRIGGGDINIVSSGDGLHSEHDEADKGYIFISGGSLSIVCDGDGIDCTNNLSILGGIVEIDAQSDGINVASSADNDNFVGSSCAVQISGGLVSIRAVEDGIDSNGSLTVRGGEVYISAAYSGNDGALDYGSTAEITGGTLAAASKRNMAMNFTSAPNQGSMLCNFNQTHTAGEEIRLSDESGNVLISYTPTLDYDAVVLSCSGIFSDGVYTVSAGSESMEIEMSGNLYSQGFGMMPMGGPGGMGGMGRPGRMDGMTPPDLPDDMGRRPGMEAPDMHGGPVRPDSRT